ncbi:uncharacterized protein LOC121404250 [Drosophila obscura]|uniref:uncharacterized protein LOC121404250 n=1 Tax=Drosophila obscura TaxID=7282 RepID=UPI001BB106BF|nr:uncharacterized protein LOC121404250 [Drosophila obscura]
MEAIREYFLKSENFGHRPADIESAIRFVNSEYRHTQGCTVENVEILRTFSPFFVTYDELHVRQFETGRGIPSKIKMLVIAAHTAELDSRFAVLHIAVAVTEDTTMGKDKIQLHVQRVLDRIGGMKENGITFSKKVLGVISDGNAANAKAEFHTYHYAHLPVLRDYIHLKNNLAERYRYTDRVLRRVYMRSIFKKMMPNVSR